MVSRWEIGFRCKLPNKYCTVLLILPLKFGISSIGRSAWITLHLEFLVVVSHKEGIFELQNMTNEHENLYESKFSEFAKEWNSFTKGKGTYQLTRFCIWPLYWETLLFTCQANKFVIFLLCTLDWNQCKLFYHLIVSRLLLPIYWIKFI